MASCRWGSRGPRVVVWSGRCESVLQSHSTCLSLAACTPKGARLPSRHVPQSERIIHVDHVPRCGSPSFFFFLFFFLRFPPPFFFLDFCFPIFVRARLLGFSFGWCSACSRRSYRCHCSLLLLARVFLHRRARIQASENRRYCISLSGHPSVGSPWSYTLRGMHPASHRSVSAPYQTSTHTNSTIRNLKITFFLRPKSAAA